MAERRSPQRGGKRSARKDDDGEVIDVDATGEVHLGRAGDDDDDKDADKDAADKDDDKDGDDDAEPDADAAYAAAAVIDVGETGDDDWEAEAGRREKASERVSLIKRDPLQAYMQEARRFPLLTPEQEKELAVRLFEHGDTVAARKLVEANLRLVVKIAYEYRRAHRNLLDLVQEGNIGLIQAVRKFDPYRGVKLSSYGAFWIRAYILKYILNNWRLVKIGTTQAQRKLFFNLRKEKERLEQLGFHPTTALIAENLHVTEKEVVEMELRLGSPEASLDAPVGGGDDDGGTRSRMEYVASEDVRPDKAVEDGEFANLLKSKLEAFAVTLEGRESTIFRERWLTDAPRTLQEIGDEYGVSRERARQLEKRLLGRLRKYLEAELGSAVDIDSFGRE